MVPASAYGQGASTVTGAGVRVGRGTPAGVGLAAAVREADRLPEAVVPSGAAAPVPPVSPLQPAASRAASAGRAASGNRTRIRTAAEPRAFGGDLVVADGGQAWVRPAEDSGHALAPTVRPYRRHGTSCQASAPAASPAAVLPSTYAVAAHQAPSSASRNDSQENVLYVVNAPQKPVPTTVTTPAGAPVEPASPPRTRQPVTLTSRVPHGNREPT